MDNFTFDIDKTTAKAQIRRDVISVLAKADGFSKKDLFNSLFDLSSLPESAKDDTDVDSAGVMYRSLIGAVLNDAIETGEVTYADHKYSLLRDMPIYIRGYEVKEYVKNLLKENVPYTKKEIFKKCEKAFGTDKTVTNKDDNRLRAYIGEYLNTCEKKGTVRVKNGSYYLSEETESQLDSYDTFIRYAWMAIPAAIPLSAPSMPAAERILSILALCFFAPFTKKRESAWKNAALQEAATTAESI